MFAYGYGYGYSLRNRPIGGYNDATNKIIQAFKTRLQADGIVVGSMKCLAQQVDAMTGPSQAEGIATQMWLRLQAAGVVTGDNTCLVNQLKGITGEQTIYQEATWDTMDETWDTIDYEWDGEWFNIVNE